MPMLKRPDGEIYYETFGNGFPILLFAPGGLRSRLEMWHHPANGPQRSWCDYTDVLASKYSVVAMDQRNAGRSKCAIEADHGWHTYAADHMALMDHLGHRKFHVLGGCIGGSFCLKAIETAPDRVVSAVLQNPIGLHPEHPEYFPRVMWPGARSNAPKGPNWTRPGSPLSDTICGIMSSYSASTGSSSGIARRRRCCCLGRTFLIRPRPATNWNVCCRGWKWCANGAARSIWKRSAFG